MTAESRVLLTERGALTLPEAVDYLHLEEKKVRALCEVGLTEIRDRGEVSRGLECFRIGQGQWRIVRESCDRWLRVQVVEYANSADAFERTPAPLARIGAGGRA